MAVRRMQIYSCGLLAMHMLLYAGTAQHGHCFKIANDLTSIDSIKAPEDRKGKLVRIFKTLQELNTDRLVGHDVPSGARLTQESESGSYAEYETLTNSGELTLTRLGIGEGDGGKSRDRRSLSPPKTMKRGQLRPWRRYALARRRRWRLRGRRRRGTARKQNVFIFGQDNRTPVFPFQTRRFPYSNVVRLSTGCTGTLVTPSFVLTAAHCVHDGQTFRTNIEMLKVEVPGAIGYKIHYVDRISIPLGWLKSKNPTESARAGFDFAVVKLNIPVTGRQEFMRFYVPSPNSLDSEIYFIGFPSYNSPGMWTSRCQAAVNMVAMEGNLLLSNCDSVAGNSGASVFTDRGRYGRRIIGILSNTASANTGTSNLPSRYSIITTLTWSKLLEICTMIGTEGADFRVCPPFPNTIEWSYKLDDEEQNALF